MKEIEVDQWIIVLKQYGPWAVVLLLIVYVIIKGELNFRFPRRHK